MDIVIAARSTPLFGTAPVAAILLSVAAVAAADPLSRADSLYALRAMGAEGHRAKPQPIAAAIAAYSEIAATDLVAASNGPHWGSAAQIRSDQITSDHIASHRIRSDQIGSDQIRSDQIE